MRPTVGRIVHYVSHGSPVREDGTQAFTAECRAALVTAVNENDTVGLCVVNPTGLFFHESVPESPVEPAYQRGGTWHFPERV